MSYRIIGLNNDFVLADLELIVRVSHNGLWDFNEGNGDPYERDGCRKSLRLVSSPTWESRHVCQVFDILSKRNGIQNEGFQHKLGEVMFARLRERTITILTALRNDIGSHVMKDNFVDIVMTNLTRYGGNFILEASQLFDEMAGGPGKFMGLMLQGSQRWVQILYGLEETAARIWFVRIFRILRMQRFACQIVSLSLDNVGSDLMIVPAKIRDASWPLQEAKVLSTLSQWLRVIFCKLFRSWDVPLNWLRRLLCNTVEVVYAAQMMEGFSLVIQLGIVDVLVNKCELDWDVFFRKEEFRLCKFLGKMFAVGSLRGTREFFFFAN